MKKSLIIIWFCCFSSLISPFCKNNLQKCFKKPFLGPTHSCGTSMIVRSPSAWVSGLILAKKKKQLRKKTLRIQKEMDKEITIWFIIDENMNKIMKKHWFFAKIKNDGNQKWWIWCFVKSIFERSTGVSWKSSGRRSTAVDEIYPLTVLK